MKLGMKHREIKSIIVYSNGGIELTLIYFMASSNFCNIGFYMGQYDNGGFFVNHCALKVKVVPFSTPGITCSHQKFYLEHDKEKIMQTLIMYPVWRTNRPFDSLRYVLDIKDALYLIVIMLVVSLRYVLDRH